MSGSPNDCQTPNRPFLVGSNASEKRAVLFRPRCKVWSCPVCGPINRARWTVRAYNGAHVLIEQGKEVDFLTLTSHERLDAAGTIAVFKHAWNNLNRRVKRTAGTYDYILVPERHEDGRLHAHLLETAHVGSRWWKDNARQSGMGYIAEEKPIRSPEGAAHYVAKYLSKGLQDTQWPDGFRRIRTSRDWPKLPALQKLEGWDWRPLGRKESVEEVCARYEEAGYNVQVMGSSSAWEYVSYGIVDT